MRIAYEPSFQPFVFRFLQLVDVRTDGYRVLRGLKVVISFRILLNPRTLVIIGTARTNAEEKTSVRYSHNAAVGTGCRRDLSPLFVNPEVLLYSVTIQ